MHAGMVSVSPVRGLRPCLALRCSTANVPKPVSVSLDSLTRASSTEARKALRVRSAAALVRLAGSYFFDKISLSHQHVLLKGSPALFQAAFLAMKKPEGIQRSKIMDRLKTFYALLSSCEAQKAAIRWKSEHVRASGRKAGSMQASCRDFSRPGCAARRNTPPSCLRRC